MGVPEQPSWVSSPTFLWPGGWLPACDGERVRACQLAGRRPSVAPLWDGLENINTSARRLPWHSLHALPARHSTAPARPSGALS